MCKDLQDSDQPLTEIFEVHFHQESQKQEWSLRTIWRHWYLINSGITTLVKLNSVDFFVTPVWNTFTGAYPILRVLWRMKIFVITWKKIFQPIFARAEQYAELGSSQQCEHANKEVISELRSSTTMEIQSPLISRFMPLLLLLMREGHTFPT